MEEALKELGKSLFTFSNLSFILIMTKVIDGVISPLFIFILIYTYISFNFIGFMLIKLGNEKEEKNE